MERTMKQPLRALAPHWSATPIARVLGPMQQFIRQEASSGIILLGMTIVALALANSPLAPGYTALLETKVAIFYSSGLNFVALAIGFALLAALVLANLLGIRSPPVYATLGVLVWLACLKSGVHATIAGVLIALTIPARMRIDAPTFLVRARD